MLTIEPGDPIEPAPCPDCGGVTTSLTRFVHKDGYAHAIYYARFSDNHPQRHIALLVGLGEWGEGTGPEDRVSFALVLRETESQYEVMVVDAEQSPWKHATVVGRTLNRDEALTHPRLKEVFHITDHMVTDDPEVRSYLESKSRNA